MGRHTRIYDKFTGYTLSDCDCQWCLYYRGKKKPCPLPICCCAEEKRLAAEKGAEIPAEYAPRGGGSP